MNKLKIFVYIFVLLLSGSVYGNQNEISDYQHDKLKVQSYNICSGYRDENFGVPLRDRIDAIADKIIQNLRKYQVDIFALQEIRTGYLDHDGQKLNPIQKIKERVAKATGIMLDHHEARNNEGELSFVQVLLWNPNRLICVKKEVYSIATQDNDFGRTIAVAEFIFNNSFDAGNRIQGFDSVRVASVHLSLKEEWKLAEAENIAIEEERRGGRNQLRIVAGDFNAFSQDPVKTYEPLLMIGYDGALSKGYGMWKNQFGLDVPGSFIGFVRKDEGGVDLLDPFAPAKGIGNPLDWIGFKFVDKEGFSHIVRAVRGFVDTSFSEDPFMCIVEQNSKDCDELMQVHRYQEAGIELPIIPFADSRPDHLGNAYPSDHLPLIAEFPLFFSPEALE